MTDLRDYQADARDRLNRASKALYVLPTGGGKTVVATSVIERGVQRGERVLTHRREILRQTSLETGTTTRRTSTAVRSSRVWAARSSRPGST
jgi:superfamily II DNA or RNA helicase